MATARKAKKAAPDAPAAEAPSAGAPAAESEASTEESAEAVPMNRAERRARGKKGTSVQPPVQGKIGRGTGPAAGPRMWANRRSG